MYVNDEKKTRRETQEVAHNMILENRKKLSISGVNEVESFNETKIVLMTACGRLTVTGHGLHVKQLHVDTGDVNILGQIDALMYADASEEAPKGGFFAGLFR